MHGQLGVPAARVHRQDLLPGRRPASCPPARRGRSGACAACATRSARPTTSPACGPPSSLSPEHITRSAPSARASAHRRLVGRHARARAGAGPSPRRKTNGTPCCAAERGEVLGGRRGGEPDHPVVGGVHLEDGARRARSWRRGSRPMRVRFVVPTSTSFAPDARMMSGIRNSPPISISSPRETRTCLPLRQRRQGTGARRRHSC